VLIVIAPGRALRWAPRWPCSPDAVLFDASSGDYWVLSSEGRRVLEWLQAELAVERDLLLSRLSLLTEAAEAMLASLGAAGLLVAMVDGVVTAVPSGVAADD